MPWLAARLVAPCPDLPDSITLIELAQYLRSQMLRDYCISDGRKKDLTLRFHIYDRNNVLTEDVGLSPGECAAA